MLTWGAPVEEPLAPLCDRFWNETARYWQRWVKHCDIPPLFQQEVIRSALALKLHCFEDTGAIVAAMTTSIPESPGSGRTWDYRYCWLRDAYYVLERLPPAGPLRGARAVRAVPAQRRRRGARISTLAPLYRVDGTTNLDETHPGRTGRATTASSRCASATPRRCTRSTTSSARWCWR